MTLFEHFTPFNVRQDVGLIFIKHLSIFIGKHYAIGLSVAQFNGLLVWLFLGNRVLFVWSLSIPSANNGCRKTSLRLCRVLALLQITWNCNRNVKTDSDWKVSHFGNLLLFKSHQNTNTITHHTHLTIN